MKNIYFVSIGNVGIIEFTNKKSAIQYYKEYVKISKMNISRAAGESIALFKNDDIILEYIGTNLN